MKQSKLFYLYLIILVAGGCTQDHLINSEKFRNLVSERFNERKIIARNREKVLFSVLDRDISLEQREALEFLFAFMPLNDLADYNGEFFLSNVDLALRTRKEAAWGNKIPDYIFLHYVLPVRVNNENLDSFRLIYSDEIASRIRGLDMKSAALEINHWCHEKVVYQPSDIRTSSPVYTILSARGRCGEESTFTVAALRAAGIPARQVYTPRWAHTDDNHAWVEIWDNGEWFYMGACEPEPVLDRGWFTEPARRAMLIHTKSFGAPYGDENTINIFRNYSEVNNLAKYALTKRIYVKVSDSDGKPVTGASVEYKLYNYAEFYPLSMVPTNEKGISSFESGFGDLLIWASKDQNFDFAKISVETSDTIFLKLGREILNGTKIDMDLSVPIVRTPYPGLSEELVKENEKKLNEENLIRQEYIKSWIQPSEIAALAMDTKIDSARLSEILKKSMGNYREIVSFIKVVPDSLTEKAMLLLEVLADKDLRDIKASVLTDHLCYCSLNSAQSGTLPDNDMIKYILNPRVSNEMIVPYRSYFKSVFSEEMIAGSREDPSILVKYINENIKIDNDDNYYKTPISPIGVNELKIADNWSRAICFVAICRSMGIKARLEEGRLIPQYYHDGGWCDVYFSDQTAPSERKGFIRLKSTDIKPVPEYYTHFTLARFEQGRYVTLEYDYNRKVTDFKDEIALPPGKYMLVTGNRISDNRIITSLTFFDLNEGEHKDVSFSLRKEVSQKVILGKLNITDAVSHFNEVNDLAASIEKSGVVIIWIDPEKEPTKHIFNDLPLLKNEMDAWGGYFLFLNSRDASKDNFDPGSLKGLPSKCLFGNDTGLAFLGQTMDVKKLPDEKMPYVMVSDNKGNIVFTSIGYKIGIGEQIIKHLQ